MVVSSVEEIGMFFVVVLFSEFGYLEVWEEDCGCRFFFVDSRRFGVDVGRVGEGREYLFFVFYF